VNGTVYNNAVFIDETIVIYPAGLNIIVYNIEKKTQKIVPLQMDGDQIGCLAVNFEEQVLAVGTRAPYNADKKDDSDKKASIYIFDLNNFKRKRVAKTTETTGAREFISITFSSDNKTIIAQGSGPES
jgi:hypothetical protein